MNKGKLKINSDNIFPIIKKWLYSDTDIFVREMVSNATDAISKIKKLDVIGEAKLEENEKFKIEVLVDDENKTISFIDNGIGMTQEEVEKYINEIAFSGAKAFIEKYEDKTNDDMIIGHFGLGFYSAFMVAKKITIETKSYKDSKAVYWECDGSDEFSMDESEKQDRGTKITLYLNDDSYEYSNQYRIGEVLNKYCRFMPYEIYLTKVGEEDKYEEIETDEKDEKGEAIKKKVKIEPKAINDTTPLWLKNPSECSEEEYKEFYTKVFQDFKEPLFWIHLNMDYPFNLKGILYFPRINNRYEGIEGRIKLYNNQVFIADNIKEVIPEFLLLLRGTIDCPDLPLNVSRSALQNDGFVKKVSEYITKKVADKLNGLCKVEREKYETYWDDIAPFIKYGCLRDDKFEQKVMQSILFKDVNTKYNTVEDLGFEKNKDKEDDKIENVDIYYVNNVLEHDSYIEAFKKQNINVIILEDEIDSAFISLLEAKHKGLHFKRIDSAITDLVEKENEIKEEEKEKLIDIFNKNLKKERLSIKVEKLKDESISSMLIVSEEGRRMSEMMKMYSMTDSMDMSADKTLILNINNSLIKLVLEKELEESLQKDVCNYIFELSQMQNSQLKAKELSEFISRSNRLLSKILN